LVAEAMAPYSTEEQETVISFLDFHEIEESLRSWFDSKTT
jgi:hypothetical protein